MHWCLLQWQRPHDYDGPELDEVTHAADAAATASGAHTLTAATRSVLAAPSGVAADPTAAASSERMRIWLLAALVLLRLCVFCVQLSTLLWVLSTQ